MVKSQNRESFQLPFAPGPKREQVLESVQRSSKGSQAVFSFQFSVFSLQG